MRRPLCYMLLLREGVELRHRVSRCAKASGNVHLAAAKRLVLLTVQGTRNRGSAAMAEAITRYKMVVTGSRLPPRQPLSGHQENAAGRSKITPSKTVTTSARVRRMHHPRCDNSLLT